MCKESLHLLTTQDFSLIGIGLADARLSIEKYRHNRAEELADIVASVHGNQNRGKECKKKQRNKLNVKYG